MLAAGGMLGVEAVDGRLVGHPPHDPGDVVLRRPRPHRRRRVGLGQHPMQLGGALAGERAQRSERLVGGQAVAGPLRVDVAVRLGRALAHDPSPEVVDLADVPHEVGGRPVRAAGHRRLRVGAAGRRQQRGRLVVEHRQEVVADPSPPTVSQPTAAQRRRAGTSRSVSAATIEPSWSTISCSHVTW